MSSGLNPNNQPPMTPPQGNNGPPAVGVGSGTPARPTVLGSVGNGVRPLLFSLTGSPRFSAPQPVLNLGLNAGGDGIQYRLNDHIGGIGDDNDDTLTPVLPPASIILLAPVTSIATWPTSAISINYYYRRIDQVDWSQQAARAALQQVQQAAAQQAAALLAQQRAQQQAQLQAQQQAAAVLRQQQRAARLAREANNLFARQSNFRWPPGGRTHFG